MAITEFNLYNYIHYCTTIPSFEVLSYAQGLILFGQTTYPNLLRYSYSTVAPTPPPSVGLTTPVLRLTETLAHFSGRTGKTIGRREFRLENSCNTRCIWRHRVGGQPSKASCRHYHPFIHPSLACPTRTSHDITDYPRLRISGFPINP